jgi:hypothetical protein
MENATFCSLFHEITLSINRDIKRVLRVQVTGPLSEWRCSKGSSPNYSFQK